MALDKMTDFNKISIKPKTCLMNPTKLLRILEDTTQDSMWEPKE